MSKTSMQLGAEAVRDHRQQRDSGCSSTVAGRFAAPEAEVDRFTRRLGFGEHL